MKSKFLVILSLLFVISPLLKCNNEIQTQNILYLLGMPVDTNKFNVFTCTVNNGFSSFQSHTLTGSHDFGETFWPASIAYDPKENYLYISFSGNGTIDVFDASSFELKAILQIPDASDIIKIGVPSDESSNRIYLVERNGSHIFVFNRTTFERIESEEFDLISPATGIWVSHDTIFVADNDGVRLYVNGISEGIFPIPETIKSLQGDASLWPQICLFAIGGQTKKVPPDISGRWALESLQVSGYLTFDNEGNIASGDEWYWNDGLEEIVQQGSYNLEENQIVLSGVTSEGPFNFEGVLRSRGDIISFIDSTAEPVNRGFGFLVKKGQNYSSTDFSGTWKIKGAYVSGTLYSDGRGNITQGNLIKKDGTTETISSGNYIIRNEDGSIIINLSTETGTIQLTGIMNKGRDIAIVEQQLTKQKNESTRKLAVLVKIINKIYQGTDIAGNWSIKAMHFSGNIFIDATGTIVEGYLKNGEEIIGITGGNCVFGENSVITLNLFTTNDETITLNGVINPYLDMIVFIDANTSALSPDMNPGVLIKTDSSEVIFYRKGILPVFQQNDVLLKINLSSDTRTDTSIEGQGLGLAIIPSKQKALVLSGSLFEETRILTEFGTETLNKTNQIPAPGNTIDCTAGTLQETQAEIQLNKICTSHGEGSALIGDEITFSITIKNTGSVAIEKIPLKDSFNPSCLSFLRATLSPDNESEGTLEWNDITGEGNLGPGESIVIHITFLAIRQANPAINTAIIHNAVDVNENPVTDKESSCEITINKQGSITVEKMRIMPETSNVKIGENVVFQIKITNNSPFSIKSFSLKDTFNPELLEFIGSSIPEPEISAGQVEWNNLPGEDNLEPETSFVFTVTFQAIKQTISTVNTAEVYDAIDIYNNSVSGGVSQSVFSILPFEVNIPGGSTTASYVMLSFPFTPQTSDISDILIDDLGRYDPTKWRLFRWNPDADPPGYEEYSPDKDLFNVTPGKAYWLISRYPVKIDGTGIPPTTKNNFLLKLSPGWNQIGCPFNFPVAWNSVIAEIGEHEYYASQQHTLWKYENGTYVPSITLQPGVGYWIWNPYSDILMLKIPPEQVKKQTRLLKVSPSTSEPQPPPPPGQTLVQSSANSSGSGCFIATACFGSVHSYQVEILRKFRDRFLTTNWLGKKFVSFYYKHSPPVANFLINHPFFKRTVRIALVPVVHICKFFLEIKS